jgi:hypothetical protein
MLLLFVTPLMIVPACGSEPAERSAIDTARAYLSFLARSDFEGAFELLSSESRAALELRGRQFIDKPGSEISLSLDGPLVPKDGEAPGPALFRVLHRARAPRTSPPVRPEEVERLDMVVENEDHGSTVVVTRTELFDSRMKLVKEGARWRVSYRLP